MAARFWVGSTGTWDASDTTHWASTSGGAGGQTVPGSGDAVTFDGSSGGGTVTVSHASLSVTSITAGAFTGTLDFGTNNNNVTAQTVSFSGSGTRNINMGSGTWTLTGTGNVFDCGTTTSLTPTFSNAAIAFSGNTTTTRVFNPGGATGGYGAWTIADNSSKGSVQIFNAGTFASITAGTGTILICPGGATTTVTGALTINGTSSAQSSIVFSNPAGASAATVSVGSASPLSWCGVMGITKSGAGSITATNSFDLGRNTTVTISAPSGGGVTGVIGG